eukprot:GAHX01001589.1.p1 GENE.GAHX01001589.1~~GAHX01001589.1.p1  ORF type:complete len:429 (-),score=76.42 GAHX01001589.1:1247-2533(-)
MVIKCLETSTSKISSVHKIFPMKSYRRHTISDKIRPKNERRALRKFGIAFVLAFTCGTVLAIILYKHTSLNDSGPSKGTSSDTDKGNTASINEKDDSSQSDHNKPDEDANIDFDIVHIQNLEEQMTFDKFEVVYNEYYKEIRVNKPIPASFIREKVTDINIEIKQSFIRIFKLFGDISEVNDNDKFKNEKIIEILFGIISTSLGFLRDYTEQGVDAFGKLDEDKKPEFLDTYINYLTIHMMMEYILSIMAKKFGGSEGNIINAFNEKFNKDKEMNKFVLKNYAMLKQIKKGMLKTIKSEMFGFDYINNKEIKDGYTKVEVMLVDKFKNFIRFFQLSFFSVISYIFEFDTKQNKLVVTENFWKYFEQNENVLIDGEVNEQYMEQLLGCCGNVLNAYAVISQRDNQDQGQSFKFEWNQEVEKCYATLQGI